MARYRKVSTSWYSLTRGVLRLNLLNCTDSQDLHVISLYNVKILSKQTGDDSCPDVGQPWNISFSNSLCQPNIMLLAVFQIGWRGRGGLRSKARHTQNVDGNPLTRTCRSYKYIHSNQSKLCISIKEKVVQCSFSLRSEAKSTDFRLLFDVISCMYMVWMSCFKTHS